MRARKKLVPEPEGADPSRARKLITALKKSATGRETADFMQKHKVRVFFVKKIESDVPCEATATDDLAREGKATILEDGSYAVLLLGSVDDRIQPYYLAHEVRHIWQLHKEINKPDYQLPYEHAIRLRFMEADAYSFGTMVVWEMAQTGDRYPWLFLKMQHRNLAHAFETEMQGSGNAIAARRAAFEAFFDNKKFIGYYTSIALQLGIADLEDMATALPSRFSAGMNPRHVAPAIIESQHTSENTLSRELLMRVGESMDGKSNYLRDIPGLDIKDRKLVRDFSRAAARKLREIEKTYDIKPRAHRRILDRAA